MDYAELKERTQALTGVDVDELIERVRVLSVEYGEQKARVEYWVDFRKAKLYSLIEEHRAAFDEKGEKVTEIRLEALARSSYAYKKFLKGIYQQKVLLVTAEAEYFAARNQLDALLEMTKLVRNEMYLNGR